MSRLKVEMMLGVWLAIAVPIAATGQETSQPAGEQNPPAAAERPADPEREASIKALEEKLGFRSINPVTGEPETAEERKARLGTTEDPGADPDPEKVFLRFGRDEMSIHKFPKSGAKFDRDPGTVRPVAYINIAREIYREDDENVWAWMFQPDAQPSQELLTPEVSKPEYRIPDEAGLKLLNSLRPEFEPLTVPPSNKTIRFVEASEGLPTAGSWRNSLSVADMDGDGHLDLLLPPQRGADSRARIYRGDGKGGWSQWREVRFDRPLDYGSAAAGDLNGDGHLDAVFGVHLNTIQVFLHDGKGGFSSEGITGLPERFATRRAVLHDLDGDGDLDILAITEGPTMAMGRADDLERPPARLQAFLNGGDGKTWKQVLIGEPRSQVGGDWMKVANLNGDRHPDIVASSIFYHGPEVLWTGKKGVEFESVGVGLMPYFSMYFAVEAGHFSSRKKEDAIFSYGRAWPGNVDPVAVERVEHMKMVGLERVSWVKGKPVRTPIVRWPGSHTIFSLGSGDFDGDGRPDLIYAEIQPREATILLGDGKGGFTEASLEGLELPPNSSYEISVADVNADGRDDVIIMFEAMRGDGSIRVWLNQGE